MRSGWRHETRLLTPFLSPCPSAPPIPSAAPASRRDSRGGGYGGGGFGLYIDPFDLFLWADPSYARRSRQRLEEGREMNFVWPWVFGDGDPNLTFEERRWRALGRHIQKL
jgi:hypothetical protein